MGSQPGTRHCLTLAGGSGVTTLAGILPVRGWELRHDEGLMAMIYAWGPLSGLHINPAVTFAFAGRGVFPRAWVVPYWVAQLGGALCAALYVAR